MDSTLTAKPAHVLPGFVYDFDMFNPPGAEADIQRAWRRLQEGPPVFWTPRHGGHWVATRGEDIVRIQRDYEVFSHAAYTVPRANADPEDMIPVSIDPPRHTSYRTLINSLLPPARVIALGEEARIFANELIDGLIGRGECEFVDEFAKHLPIVMFLRLVNLPLDDRRKLLAMSEKAARPRNPEKNRQAFVDLHEYMQPWIDLRRREPGDDAISRIVHGKVEGRPLNDREIMAILNIVMFGGLDTVASMLGFIAWHLARHARDRARLRDEPGIVPHAVEEFLRRYGVANNGRLVMRDVELGGALLRKGDQIVVPNGLYGLDEHVFPDALRVDFDRSNVIHAAFGNGPHRCPGSFLARTELRVFIEEWLRRIPDFEVKRGESAQMRSGFVNGMIRLPLQWQS